MRQKNTTGTDGRRARSGRSRNAIATAMLELIVGGMPHPAARQVAERAGVSPRLVFHHFADMEAIYGELMALQAERLKPLLEMDIQPEMAFEDRLTAFAEHRATILEFISPVRRMIVGAEVTSPAMAAELERLRAFKRQQTAAVFAPEIARLAGETVAEVTAALQAATAWTTWHSLRHHQKLPVEAAEKVMIRTIRALLAGSVPCSSSPDVIG
jgi:TetR/AcrR family transcriptional regulator, regulator of autoinduction and epiphytic fitness